MKSLRWETWEICGGRYVGDMGNTRSMRLSEAIPPVGLQRRGRVLRRGQLQRAVEHEVEDEEQGEQRRQPHAHRS